MSSQYIKEVKSLLNAENEGSITERFSPLPPSMVSLSEASQVSHVINSASQVQKRAAQLRPHNADPVPQKQEKAEVCDDFLKSETNLLGIHNKYAAAWKQALRNQQEQWESSMINQQRQSMLLQEVVSLESSRSVEETFPIEVLPKEAQDLIEIMSSGSEARKEVIAVGLLGAVSAATQGNWFISDSSAFTQPLTFYSIVAAPSGFGKSTTCDVLVIPFMEHDSKSTLEKSSEGGLSRKLALSAGMTAYKGVVRNAVVKEGCSIGEAMVSSKELLEELQELEKSQSDDCKVSRLLYRTTMEQLPFEMARRKGAAAIIDPEGGLLTMITGRKNDILLKGFDGESFESSTRTSGRVRIENAFLSITSFVQPSKLIAFCGKKEAADHGVHPRFCMMLARAEELPKDLPMPVISDSLMAWYKELILCLLSSERSGVVEPQNEIRLSKAAERRLLSGVRDMLRGRERSDGLLGPFESRLQQHTKNIAGLLLLMHRGRYFLPEGDGVAFEMDEGLMVNALKVMRFFHAHAQVILSPEFAEGLNFAKKILRWIKRDSIDWFTDRDAHRAIGSGRCKVDQVLVGLAELERCNYISRFVGARKKSIYVVHPAVMRVD